HQRHGGHLISASHQRKGLIVGRRLVAQTTCLTNCLTSCAAPLYSKLGPGGQHISPGTMSMKRIRVLAVLTACFLFSTTLQAQETPESQLDFVRKLRVKGYLDLATEYLDRLRAIPDPAVQALVPLESARISIATARTREPDQRPALFAAARKDLQAYVDRNPGRPEAAQARLEIARLAAFQGETLLTKALREDDAKSRTEQARKAESQFIQAGQELEVAAKQLGDFAVNYKNPDAELEKKIREQLQQDA